MPIILLLCATGNTSTGFEGTQHQLEIKMICPRNMHIHARLANQAAQNAYYESNKRAPTTALCRAQ